MSGKWFAKASQDREYFSGFPSSKGSVSEIEIYILAHTNSNIYSAIKNFYLDMGIIKEF